MVASMSAMAAGKRLSFFQEVGKVIQAKVAAKAQASIGQVRRKKKARQTFRYVAA